MSEPPLKSASLHLNDVGADTCAVMTEQRSVTDEKGTRDRERSLFAYVPYLFVVLSLIAVVLRHAPWLPVQMQAAGHSFSNLIGQEVRWTMFSADPRGIAVDLWAEVEYVEGSRVRWSIDRSVPELRFMRWSVWTETAVLLAPVDQLEALAGWIESQAEEPVSRIDIYGSQRGPGVIGEERPPPEVGILYTWERGQ